MIPRPPRSTRTDTLFPYTTLFRSNGVIDENYWLAAYIGGALGRDAGWTVNAYANWLSSTDPFVGEVAGYGATAAYRSEEHTSELQSLMRISYAVFCLKKKKYTSNAS